MIKKHGVGGKNRIVHNSRNMKPRASIYSSRINQMKP